MIDPTRPTSTRERGLTLLDLIIGMVVAAMVLVVLLPMAGRLRQQAKLAGCMQNLRQMSQVLSAYAGDHGDFPYYNYVGAPPPAERNHLWQKNRMACSGISTWQLLLPELEKLGYGNTTRSGYCPMSYGSPDYRWGCSFEIEMGYNRGNYLYVGPGTYGVWWVPHIMSPKLVDRDKGEFKWVDENKRHMREWGGVHADGTVRLPFPPNGPQRWSGLRVPIMGEASLEAPDKRRAAPHMSRFKDAMNFNESGGLMNFLFTDGSVVTYPYSF